MRVLNLIGSVMFIVYGVLLPAISTAILNAGLVIVNTVHLVVLLKTEKQKQNAQGKAEQDPKEITANKTENENKTDNADKKKKVNKSDRKKKESKADNAEKTK